MSDAALTICGLHVAIGPAPILRDVALTAPAGALSGLIGRNGAGKTTLMRTVMGLLAPAAGTVQFAGAALDREPAQRRVGLGIGYMPEDRRLVPGFTVEENVLLPAWAARLGDAAERLAWIYGVMPEVRGLRERRANQLSGGQQKLVALGRALMAGRRLLLLDEPFEGVAPVLARRLAEVLADLKRAGLTILVADSSETHLADLLDAAFVIERGAVSPRGRGAPA